MDFVLTKLRHFFISEVLTGHSCYWPVRVARLKTSVLTAVSYFTHNHEDFNHRRSCLHGTVVGKAPMQHKETEKIEAN